MKKRALWILGLSVGVPPLPEAAVLRHAPGEADEVVGALEEAVLGAAAVHRVLEAAVLRGAPEDGLLDLIPLSVEEVVVDVVLALVAVALLVDRVLDVGPEGGWLNLNWLVRFERFRQAFHTFISYRGLHISIR